MNIKSSGAVKLRCLELSLSFKDLQFKGIYALSIMKSTVPAPLFTPYSFNNHSRNCVRLGVLDCTKTFVKPAG